MKKTKKQQLDELNTEVTAAIFELEAAQQKVVILEERIARLTKPNTAEGEVARRRAVRAALAGRCEEWAAHMIQRFCAEKGALRKFKESLQALLK